MKSRIQYSIIYEVEKEFDQDSHAWIWEQMKRYYPMRFMTGGFLLIALGLLTVMLYQQAGLRPIVIVIVVLAALFAILFLMIARAINRSAQYHQWELEWLKQKREYYEKEADISQAYVRSIFLEKARLCQEKLEDYQAHHQDEQPESMSDESEEPEGMDPHDPRYAPEISGTQMHRVNESPATSHG